MMRDRQQAAGWLIVAASLVYLWTFVPRGWVPHDEGMLGQSAEHVMLGHMPHVDYEELYTGGLTVLHAAAFRVFGVDLVHLRWVLFAAVALGQLLIYVILRRSLEPVGAAFASALALTWSFPNYFASLPSWWVLLCALGCVWGFIRYVETESLRYAALAGLAAGLAIAFKQTGLYVLVALVMAFMYGRGARPLRAGIAVAGIGLAMAVMRSRIASTDALYLFLPIVACGAILVAAERRESDDTPAALRAIALVVLCAALPLIVCVIPYVRSGHVGTLLNGLLVIPQRRLEFASLAMEHTYFILIGVPCVALVTPLARRLQISGRQARFITMGLSIVAAIVIAASVDRYAAYQLFWQSGRGFAALLPVAVSWLLFAGHDDDPNRGRVLFGTMVMLAWASLVQFPFSGAIYFCYTVPLAVIAGAASAKHFSSLKNPALVVWCAALIVFAVLTMNRGYLDSLGAWHQPMALDQKLDLPRAHLEMKPEEVAEYRRVTELVTAHVGNGELLAGPDSPEVYFLARRLNPSGVFFEFFSGGLAGEGDAAWTETSVVVLNHRPGFSPAPSERLSGSIRNLFPHGESVGRFEVRWR
jgi:hypothetical protein